jgi:hypothetical protein
MGRSTLSLAGTAPASSLIRSDSRTGSPVKAMRKCVPDAGFNCNVQYPKLMGVIPSQTVAPSSVTRKE